jgi:RNA methyltransferase, TrmH family
MSRAPGPGPGGTEITSIRSPRVKAARQLARRTYRERTRSFLAEGPQAVREALAAAAAVTELFVTGAAWSRHGELIARAAAAGAPVHLVSGEVMAELAQTVTPQGLLAVCRFVDVPLPQLVAGAPRLLVVLASVRDPGNAGTVLRTADAAGAQGVIFADSSVDPYNSKCVRASAGSLFHLAVVSGEPISEVASALRRGGLRLLAADGKTGRNLGELESAGQLARPTAWLFGNEAWGLPDRILSLADEAVAVPIYGRAESLNLAAAAAVCLYASAAAQRRPGAAAARSAPTGQDG